MKKGLFVALSLCGFAITSAQAEVVQMNGDTLVYEQTFSKGLGEANGMVIATGYGSMADIKTPIRSEDQFSAIVVDVTPTNLGQQSDNSAERTVFYED